MAKSHMRRLYVWSASAFVFVCLLTLAAYVWFSESESPAPHDIVATGSDLQTVDCPHASVTPHHLKCYWFYPDWPKTTTRLPVHVYQSGAATSQAPLLYLPGGPGEMRVTGPAMHELIEQWLLQAELTRDFVILDFRGNLNGAPYYLCESLLPTVKKQLQRNLTMAQEVEQLYSPVQQCLLEFARVLDPDVPANQALSKISTHQNAIDTRAVMRSLDYSEWHLAGVSYGTRVALQAAATQSEVRSIILDSPYPFFAGDTVSELDNWAHAFDRFFSYCTEKPGMCGDHGDLNTLFWQVSETLKSSPLSVRSENWDTQLNTDWVLNHERLAALVYTSLYHREDIASLGVFLSSLHQGTVKEDFLLDAFYNLLVDPYFNDLVHIVTECNDNVDSAVADVETALVKFPNWAEMFRPVIALDICQERDLFAVGPRLSDAMISAPALVVAGELDPVTPAWQAKELADTLARAMFVELDGQGHASFFWGECGPHFVTQFLSQQDSNPVSPNLASSSLASSSLASSNAASLKTAIQSCFADRP